jgi:alpha-galactosidase
MPIEFVKDKNLFHLHNREFSYYVYVHKSGMLLCPYFGAYVEDIDTDQINYIGGHDWFSNYYDNDEKIEKQYEKLYMNASMMLMPSARAADVRPSAISIEGDINCKLDFRYLSHRIYKGKPQSESLPYVRDERQNAETLEITMCDFSKDILVILSLSVFENYNAVIRNTKFVNATQKAVWLKKAMSVSQDFPKSDFDVVHFPGEWLFERQFRRESLTEGTKIISSSTGRSSHEHNPFVMLADKEATETHGEVYAASFLYSGSFKSEVHVGKVGVTRLNMGIGDSFKYEIKSGESFDFPEGLIMYSGCGFEKISHQLHDLIRFNIVKDNNVEAYRSILLNSWEGCYMDFDTDKVIDFIRSGKKVGVEMFVLDDGWFGKRDDDRSSLGDWYVNEKKIDIKKVVDECHKNGMKFGIWIEPEMANFDSDLLREHPEFAAVDVTCYPWLSRHQVMLNFADEKVVDYVYALLENTLAKYEIDYVKWDNNRTLEDYFANNLDTEHQDEFYHRNTLGYYRLAEKLTKRFPKIHFQGCASGGGRFDLGTLFYFPEIWTSDENNPVQRLFIQYGTSFAYPPSVMGAHVNDCPATCYRTKAEIALFGSYGFELDPRKLSEKDIEEIKSVNIIYKKYRDVILNGDMYRLSSPYDGKAFAINMVDKNKEKAVFLMVNLLKKTRAYRFVKLRGLAANKHYLNNWDNKAYSGDYYMKVGINLSEGLGEFESRLIVLEEAE